MSDNQMNETRYISDIYTQMFSVCYLLIVYMLPHDTENLNFWLIICLMVYEDSIMLQNNLIHKKSYKNTNS